MYPEQHRYLEARNRVQRIGGLLETTGDDHEVAYWRAAGDLRDSELALLDWGRTTVLPAIVAMPMAAILISRDCPYAHRRMVLELLAVWSCEDV